MRIGIVRIEFQRRVGVGAGLCHRSFEGVLPAESGVQAMVEAEHGVERRGFRVERERFFPTKLRGLSIVLGGGLTVIGQTLDPIGPGLHVVGRRVRACSPSVSLTCISVARTRVISSWIAKISSNARSYRSAQRCDPSVASISCAVTRIREPL